MGRNDITIALSVNCSDTVMHQNGIWEYLISTFTLYIIIQCNVDEYKNCGMLYFMIHMVIYQPHVGKNNKTNTFATEQKISMYLIK